MFNVGGPEFLVIAVVALIVLGPDRLPGALRQAGQFMTEIRNISNGFKVDLKAAIADVEADADGTPTRPSPQREALDALRRLGDGVSGVLGGSEPVVAGDDPIAVARAELAELEAGDGEATPG